MLNRLKIENKLVGTKQVKRALNGDDVKIVYLAKDADREVVSTIINLCEDKNIDIYYLDTMEELGKACQIDVSAAVAALLNK